VAESVRFYFDTPEAAAAGLLTVLLDARTTDADYRFGGLNKDVIYTSGLLIEGDISAVAAKVASLPGAARLDE
jgi:hypothetical protein